jgi:HEAT repeat protein
MRLLPTVSLVTLLLLSPHLAIAEDDQEVAEARKNLADSNPAVRVKAAQALARLGPKAAPAAGDLVKAAREKDFAVRFAALQALRAIGADAVPALAEGLKDSDDYLRRMILPMLQRHADKAAAAVPALALLIRDADPSTRNQAIQIIARTGDEGVKALAALLKDKDEALRTVVVYALGYAKPSAELWAAAKLASKDPAVNVRQQGLNILARQGTDAVPLLVGALSDESLQIRLAVIGSLGNLRQSAKAAVPDLEKMLDDKVPPIRQATLSALTNIGPRTETLARLMPLLDDPDPTTRNAVLGLLIAGGKDGLPHLEKVMKSRNVSVRLLLAENLGRLGAPSLPLLTATLKDQSADVRAAAADGLGQLGQAARESTKELHDLLKDDDRTVRVAAAGALLRVEEKPGLLLLPLLEGLEDDDFTVREKAERTLGTVRGLIGGDLLKLLTDKDPVRRRQATLALTTVSFGSADFIAALMEAFKDESEPVRRNAEIALGKIGLPAANALGEALKSNDDRTRIHAATAFAHFQNAPQGIPGITLNEALKDKNPMVRVQSARALRATASDTVLDVLIESAKNDKAEVRRAALAGLVATYIPRPGVAMTKRQTALTEALKDSDLGVRLYAADGLVPFNYSWTRADVNTREMIPKILIEVLSKGTGEERRQAMRVFANVRHGAAPAVEALTAAMRDKDYHIRQYAASVLGSLGPDAKPAVKALADGLSDRLLGVRQNSAMALRAIGPEAKEAVPALAKALEDTDIIVRLSAVVALGRIGPPSRPAVPALRKLLKDQSAAPPGPLGFPGRPAGLPPVATGNVQAQVVEALTRIGPGAAEAAPDLVLLLNDKENEAQRRAAASALSAIGAEAAPALLEGLKSKDPNMRALCAEALGGVSASEEVVKALAGALEDSYAPVSQQAAFTLGQLGEPAKAALPKLLAVLKNRQSATELWQLAAQAIGEMGPAAKDAVGELREALKSEEPLIRKAAAQALGGIGPQAKDAAAALSDLARDPDFHVRRAATRALARINREP